MLVPNQFVEVRIGGRNLGHYKKLGYDVMFGDTIRVPVEHLTPGSHVEVEVLCDICGEKIKRDYKQYLYNHTRGYDTCSECKQVKYIQTSLERYGVINPMYSDEIREKTMQAVINKYETNCTLKVTEIQQKARQTCINRYGTEYYQSTQEYKDRYRDSCMKHYGCPYALQSEEVKDKSKQTNLIRYGYENPMQNPQIKEKAIKTMYEHGTQKTSTQQLKVYEMIKNKHPDAILNYPFSSLSLDIFVEINNVKIDVEYDGWFFHQDKQKDIKRDKFLQSQGFKTLRIRSGRLLPTEQELFDAIDYLVNTEHHFKEIILSDWKEVDKYESLFDSAAV